MHTGVYKTADDTGKELLDLPVSQFTTVYEQLSAIALLYKCVACSPEERKNYIALCLIGPKDGPPKSFPPAEELTDEALSYIVPTALISFTIGKYGIEKQYANAAGDGKMTTELQKLGRDVYRIIIGY